MILIVKTKICDNRLLIGNERRHEEAIRYADAGVITSADGNKVAYISLDETIKEQEAAGLTCR